MNNTVGAASGLVDWNDGSDVTMTNGSALNDGLWRWRGDQGSLGVWEATGSNAQVENAVEIKTTVTSLISGLYDVFVFYDSSTAGDWPIRAGLTSNPGMNQIYDRSGATPGSIAGFDPFSGPFALNFEVTPPNAGSGQTMRYAKIGQFDVTDGNLLVFVDDLPATSSGNRTWYEGIGYQLAGTGPPIITSVMSGMASNGSTWSNNQPPNSANKYEVVSGHTVTVDAPFDGLELKATSGTEIAFSVSTVHVPILIIESGANLTESVSGDFALGDISQPTLGSLQLNQNINFDIDAGSDFFLDMTLRGEGDIDFNSGNGSVLWLSAAGGHLGVVRFNGTGDQVRLTERQSFGTLEMNSTGANVLYHAPAVTASTGTLIFNQPGTIDHATESDRLQGVEVLEANAAVTIDLSKGYPTNGNQTDERRYQVADAMRGSGDVTVNGTAVDYSNSSGISLNEFEVDNTGEPSTVEVSTYSGTLTGNDFVNIEIRQHFRDARFVVGNNARLEMGHQAIDSAHSIELGEVVVNNGGIFEVGFEQTSSAGVSGHHIYQTTLTDSGSREGTLTVNPGGTLRMQINGTAANEFDAIIASGDVQLGGTLNVLVNPDASSGGGGTAANPIWTPAVGQTFDIITLAAGPAPAGDYDGSGTVDNGDYDLWRMHFDSNNADADGNKNGVVDAADYVIWRKNFGATGGTDAEISGTFSNVLVTDFNGAMTGLGFKVNYLPAAVQIEVISAPGAGIAVPEPSTPVLAGMLLPLFTKRRARR
ncbi:MAG TPA: hypothetical protein VJ828_11285 [Lacipirellulaceae bacterium]|nr:hypothetical protein [Lacipirellulaceae bacterium]